MPFVVDASVAASWLLPDEGDPRAKAAYARFPDDFGLAPGLWWYEVHNIFIINERRGRIDGVRADHALALLAALPIRLDHSVDESRLMGIARRHRLTAYDAAYIELAQREALPLATLDDSMVRAARAEHIMLVGESG